MVLVIVVAAPALLAGLAANRWLRPRLVNADDNEGMAVKDLVGPLLTMSTSPPPRRQLTSTGRAEA
ncbi:hypothetical protein ACFTXJ_15325 [Streptomyces zhihengii]|uniref:hypothetical protein n=1 Tax=Streptomyces zhihengii TaxID=1818004 RepID=UPI0036459E99